MFEIGIFLLRLPQPSDPPYYEAYKLKKHANGVRVGVENEFRIKFRFSI